MLPLADPPTETIQASRQEMMGFASFLGSRWLVTNYQWTSEGLRLPLMPASGMRWGLFEHFWPKRGSSYVVISPNGQVQSSLGPNDRKALARLGNGQAGDSALAERVNSAVQRAWLHVRNGELADAERLLGERSETDVYRIAPGKTRLTRGYKWMTYGFAALAVGATALQHFRPPWIEGLHAVKSSESEIRAALATVGTDAGGTNARKQDVTYPLSFSLVLPEAELFSPEALAFSRAEILRMIGFDVTADAKARCANLARSWLAPQAILAGWVRLEDLGLDAGSMAGFLRDPAPYHWQFHLPRYSARHRGEEYVVERFDCRSLAQLRWFRDLGDLEVLNREELARKAAALQVLSAEAKAGRPRLRNWRDIRGFFSSFSGPILEETYSQLAALEMLGGLDQIDREACIRAILKLHRGRGYFVRPDTEESWRFQVRGDATDTFCAFESLRILGALDRVRDLPKWQFRVKSRANTSQPDWPEIEAWLYAREFSRYLSGQANR